MVSGFVQEPSRDSKAFKEHVSKYLIYITTIPYIKQSVISEKRDLVFSGTHPYLYHTVGNQYQYVLLSVQQFTAVAQTKDYIRRHKKCECKGLLCFEMGIEFITNFSTYDIMSTTCPKNTQPITYPPHPQQTAKSTPLRNNPISDSPNKYRHTTGDTTSTWSCPQKVHSTQESPHSPLIPQRYYQSQQQQYQQTLQKKKKNKLQGSDARSKQLDISPRGKRR